jgi:pimeloyl-ACP methyl ester carboxylesterase
LRSGAAVLSSFIYVKPDTFLRYWVPTSNSALADAEQKMLAHLKVHLAHSEVQVVVPMPKHQSLTLSIHTVVTQDRKGTPNDLSVKPPLVLLHGFGGGVGIFTKNFEELSEHYTVYAIDIPGFGRSTKPVFLHRPATSSESAADFQLRFTTASLLAAAFSSPSSSSSSSSHSSSSSSSPSSWSRSGLSADCARHLFVVSLEAWRQAVGLEKMTLLGHSMGGYIAGDYALHFPDRVSHLLLAAPFGFKKRAPSASADLVPRQLPVYARAIVGLGKMFGPMSMVRGLGPLGPYLVRLRSKYDNGRYEFKDGRVSEYIYHLIANCKGGDEAFLALNEGVGYAVTPLSDFVQHLPMPVTLIYGEKDFITPDTGKRVREIIAHDRCQLVVIDQAGHHAYATHTDQFHKAVLARRFT